MDREKRGPVPEMSDDETVEINVGVGEAIEDEAGTVDIADDVTEEIDADADTVEIDADADTVEVDSLEGSSNELSKAVAKDIKAEAAAMAGDSEEMTQDSAPAAKSIFDRAAELGMPDLANMSEEQFAADKSRKAELEYELSKSSWWQKYVVKGATRAELRQINARLDAVARLEAAAADAVPFEEDDAGGRDKVAGQRERTRKAQQSGKGGFGR